ncbi:MAG: TipAS antibiotic-recognition domain-containing protein [Anaerolineaceae bacterium]|nr:TipAS antibiotic-recognition domain-containing protein [Anaerolineaceae bacterium]MBN2677510.1 TipAS antibiotic-recognition domain-containing protein [Anaerolineaceae bacterium]
MNDRQLFAAFSEQEQAGMEKEAMRLYDPETVKASNKKWKSYTANDIKRIFEEGNALYLALVEAIPAEPGSTAAQAGIERWQLHMNHFWTPSPEQLVVLADHYSLDPRFKTNFDKIDPRLAEFMDKAVQIHIEALKNPKP